MAFQRSARFFEHAPGGGKLASVSIDAHQRVANNSVGGHSKAPRAPENFHEARERRIGDDESVPGDHVGLVRDTPDSKKSGDLMMPSAGNPKIHEHLQTLLSCCDDQGDGEEIHAFDHISAVGETPSQPSTYSRCGFLPFYFSYQGSLRERRSLREDGEFEEDDCAELLKIHTRGQGQVFVLNAGKMFQSGREAGRELRLMSKLRGCAGVVSLAGFVRKRSGGACYGTMVMELCGPSLCHRLIKGGPLGEKEAAKTIQRLAEGLKGIHTSGIIHPNLKPENIFVKLDATAVHEVVIGDFGVATDDPKEMSQYCGTGKYMAPEMTSCKSGHGDSRLRSFYTTAIDVWE
ncbi:calcium/calmodulin-dependent protein kinase type 1-like [Selaginella moellendorffii]|uniref:calcium/calmodulin-dependent protein kinase type 1-like n=1 Tax=Selaginella moellendorffii TaxID=88036 RepID=UPI000D1D10CC|nr:calcium/calmodulin-dependent protein kinase type 1-like [Selaginella moellendorffii]|eukprot:XP_024545666.1 calcium/calmodulin-dependent protein kinase type 1-like [Selaginella moellendorffii]